MTTTKPQPVGLAAAVVGLAVAACSPGAEAPDARPDATDATDAAVDPGDGGIPDVPEPGPRPRVVGTVLSPRFDGFDIVPGASVRLPDGRVVQSDDLGRFVLEDPPLGSPLRLVVEGPGRASEEVVEPYGTNEVTVTVTEAGAQVVLHVLRACRGAVPAARGGVAVADRCAGAGGIEVELEAGGVVAEAGSFSGTVEVRMTALDPRSPTDLLGIPDDGMGALGPPVRGAMEVELLDAVTGAPLQIADGAQAVLRLELSSLPEGVEAEDLVFEFWDEAAGGYGEPHPVRLLRRGERLFGEVVVEHFSRGRVVDGPLVGPTGRVETCLTLDVEICPGGAACEPRAAVFHVVDLDLRRAFEAPVSRDGGSQCLILAASSSYRIDVRWADPLLTAVLEQPVYQTTFVHSTGPPPRGGPMCGSNCEALGSTVRLQPQRFGCAKGTFRSSGGDLLAGPVRVLLDGYHVSSGLIPAAGVCSPECMGTVCLRVPVFRDPDQGLEIEGVNGNRFELLPDARTAGERCQRTRPLPCGYCDLGAGCQDLGDTVAACDPELANHGCLDADFTHSLTEGGGGCSGSLGYQLELDGTSSIGRISNYQWTVTGVDGAPQPLDPLRVDRQPVLGRPFCVGEGVYRVELRTPALGRSWFVGRSERIIFVGPRLPCHENQVYSPGQPRSIGFACNFTLQPDGGLVRDCSSGTPPITRWSEMSPLCGHQCRTVAQSAYALPGWTVRGSSEADPSTGPATRTVQNVLDGFGNVIEQTTWRSNAEGQSLETHHFVYDDPSLPRRVEQREDAGGAPGRLVSVEQVTYDAVGRVSTVEYGGVSRTFRYQGGRRVGIDTDVDGEIVVRTSFAYDPSGQLTELWSETPDGSRVLSRSVFTYCP